VAEKRSYLIHPWLVCVVLMALLTVSCGTLLYPERRGQISGRVDPAVILMDGLLCFLFIIPGLIAFVVDFSTGAIYLPAGTSYPYVSGDQADSVKFYADLEQWTPEELARVVEKRTGQRIRLSEETVQVYELRSRAEISEALQEDALSRLALKRVALSECPLFEKDDQKRAVARR